MAIIRCNVVGAMPHISDVSNIISKFPALYTHAINTAKIDPWRTPNNDPKTPYVMGIKSTNTEPRKRHPLKEQDIIIPHTKYTKQKLTQYHIVMLNQISPKLFKSLPHLNAIGHRLSLLSPYHITEN